MPAETPPDFTLTRPEDIRAALFELTHPDSHVVVRDAADRDVAVLILGADKQTGFFFWRPRDYAGAGFDARDRQEVMTGTVFHFIATGYGGVRIHFRVPRPQVIHFDDNSAAYISGIPDCISRIQRRKIFRAPLGAVKAGGHCRIGSDVPAIPFSVRDISVEGVGLRLPMRVGDLPQRGTILDDVELEFGEWGKLKARIEVRNVYPVSGQPELTRAAADSDAPIDANSTMPVGSEETRPAAVPNKSAAFDGSAPESHLGATFLNLSGRDEIWLQQVVWRLEKKRQQD